MHKKIQPMETTGKVISLSEEIDNNILQKEECINNGTVEMVIRRLCNHINVPVSYNLAELLDVLKMKKLVQNSEIERLENNLDNTFVTSYFKST